MRRQIAKNLQTRSRAIRTALNAYNTAASAINRPTLDWRTVSHYRFLQEFTLLNDTRADLRDKLWAQPVVRETMRRANKLARAREEIARVSDEALRILASIRDEELLFCAVLEDLIRGRYHLYGAVADFVRRRRRANAHVQAGLKKLFAHPRFSGSRAPGNRPGGSLPALVTYANLDQLLQMTSKTQDAEGDEAEDEHAQDMFTIFTDFIASVHT